MGQRRGALERDLEDSLAGRATTLIACVNRVDFAQGSAVWAVEDDQPWRLGRGLHGSGGGRLRCGRRGWRRRRGARRWHDDRSLTGATASFLPRVFGWDSRGVPTRRAREADRLRLGGAGLRLRRRRHCGCCWLRGRRGRGGYDPHGRSATGAGHFLSHECRLNLPRELAVRTRETNGAHGVATRRTLAASALRCMVCAIVVTPSTSRQWTS